MSDERRGKKSADLSQEIKGEGEAPAALRATDMERLLHDLRVHQTELEVQNLELRETQALLEDSRNRYVDLYDFAPIGYCSFDQEGRIRECNLAAAALLGRSRSMLIDGPFVALATVVDDQAFRDYLGSCFASDETRAIEVELVVGERTPVSVRMVSQRARSHEGALLCRTALIDVTERNRAEAALRFLAEVSTELASSLDYRTTLARVAHLAVPRLGDCCVIDVVADDGSIAPIAVAHVDPWKEPAVLELRRAHPADPRLSRGVTTVIRTRRPEVYPPVDEVAPPFTPLDATHSGFLRELGARAYICLPLSARDKTLGAMTFASLSQGKRFGPPELALAEALAPRCALALDNARLYEDAQRAIRARQDLLAVVSHDLKNPLNAIALNAQMLGRSGPHPDSGVVEKRVASIGRAVDRMEYLIRDLLDLSSIEAGHLKVDRSPHDLRVLVEDAMELVRPLAVERSLQLRAELPEEQVSVSCDAERVLRVFSNIVGNAIKFTPKGGTITVSAFRLDDEVRISVADTGPGIAQDLLPHVFERYWQAEEVARDGAGLGLFIAKAIVESHGGRIWARSRVGQGSIFFFTLPLAVETKTARSSVPEGEARSVPRTVLVVDDDEGAREGLANLLCAEGYAVATASNGREALAYLEVAAPPGLILLDLRMPVMDGPAFTAEAKAKTNLASIPIVLMSGERQLAEFATRLGAEGHIGKPLRRERLLETIERCARWS